MSPGDIGPEALVRGLGAADAALPPGPGAAVTLAQLQRRQRRRLAARGLALTLLVALFGSALALGRSPAAAVTADLAAARAEVQALRSLLASTQAAFAAATAAAAAGDLRLGVMQARARAALTAHDDPKETRR